MALEPIKLRRERLQAVLDSIQEMELASAAFEKKSPYAQDQFRLLQAYRDLAVALNDSIRAEEDRPVTCLALAKIEERHHNAAINHVRCETGLAFLEGGTFAQRWDRHVAAKKEFWRTLEARWSHRPNCPICLENISKEARRSLRLTCSI